MKRHTPLFWIQATALVMPIGFLLAGGCGGGGGSSNNNGGFFDGGSSSPILITPTPSPSPTFNPNAPTPTTAPTPTPTPRVLTNFSPEFSFSSRNAVAAPDSLRLFVSNATTSTLSIGIPNNIDFQTGLTYIADGPALEATPSRYPRELIAGVTYVEGTKTWHARNISAQSGREGQGTVVLSIYQSGPIPTPDAKKFREGILFFQLSEVLMVPDPATDATGTLIITGPFNANSGGVYDIGSNDFSYIIPSATTTTTTKRR